MDTIKDLGDRGYNVRVNGPHTYPLTGCSVDAVRGGSSIPASTVHVDLRCPPARLND